MTDKELTELINKRTFSAGELSILSQCKSRIKTYIVTFDDGIEEVEELKSTSDLSILEYLNEFYMTEHIIRIQEKLTTYREVDYSFKQS
jgi:hypothetical protein